MALDLAPPALILPSHYEAHRPAIIRPEVDPLRYFPVALTRSERRAVIAELRRSGRVVDGQLPGTQPVVAGGAAKDPFSITYGGSGSLDSNGATVHSIPSLAIGAAPTGANVRYVAAVVGLTGNSSFTVTGVTIAGLTAALVAGLNTSNAAQCQIWIVAVPTGTTATVDVTASGSDIPQACGVSVYPIINPTSSTPDATAGSQALTATISLNLNISSGGKAIGGSVVRDTPGNSTWTGLTENYDADIRSGEIFTTATGGSAGSPATVSVTRGAAVSSNAGAVSASWH